MANANELVRLIKQASVDAVDAGKPQEIYFGKMMSPTSCRIDQKLVLDKEFLVFSRNVTNYGVKMNIPTVGSVSVTVNNALKAGEEVLVQREQGGQRYIILDRIGRA